MSETIEVPRDEFEQLVEKVERIDEENEQLRERVDELEQENEELRKRVETLQEDVWNIEEAAFGEVSSGMAATWADEDGDLLERIEDLEHAVEATEAESAKAFASEDPRKMLPIEKLAELPDDVAKQQLDTEQNRNLYRARYIWNNWENLQYAVGDYDNRAYHLKSSDVKRALNTWDEEETHVESKTVERVFRRLAEWSFWICETRQKDGERRLWRPGEWREQREDAREDAELNGHPLADSVVSGGR